MKRSRGTVFRMRSSVSWGVLVEQAEQKACVQLVASREAGVALFFSRPALGPQRVSVGAKALYMYCMAQDTGLHRLARNRVTLVRVTNRVTRPQRPSR
jgi:hypothetical protein